ncbi:MAG: hypothetical protein QNJ47_18555 [Nostocaceae cyanobacterium]|nr:hypothetical protein [Nostocaceae cyanobacterium]
MNNNSNWKSYLLMFGLSMTLIGCGGSPDVTTTSSPSPTQTSTPTPTSTAPTTPTTPSASQTISEKGIGEAKLEMTYGELKKALGSNVEFKVESPYMVDFDAIAVTKGGKVQYYILYPTGKTFADTDKIRDVLTNNPDYRTDKGIGPGTTIKQAAAEYGDPTLYYSTANESREFVKFANFKPDNIYFRPKATNQGFAGVYPSQIQEYNKTGEFQSGATINTVQVSCSPTVCQ